MRLQGFLESYPNAIFSSDGDEIFTYFRLSLHGMCSIRMAKLLNHACKFLDEKECYLEIGTYAGFTLLSAGYESGKRFIGVDNFSENFSVSGTVRDRLKDNLSRHPGSYLIMDSDFRNVDLTQILEGLKVGVFLIDGKHCYEDVMTSMGWVKPHLSSQAVIVFDDANVPEVKMALDQVKKDFKLEEVFFANSFYDGKKDSGMSSDKYIHNGFSVMVYRE